MKKLLTIIATLAVAAGAYAQGNIKFANAAGTALRFDSNAAAAGGANLAGQKLAPGANFIVGLYIANGFGAAEGTLQLYKTTGIAAPATSVTHAFAGTYAGGNPLAVSAAYITGADITFQIKAWSAGFATYEAALASPLATTYAGKSTLGTYSLKGTGVPVTDTMLATPTGEIGRASCRERV